MYGLMLAGNVIEDVFGGGFVVIEMWVGGGQGGGFPEEDDGDEEESSGEKERPEISQNGQETWSENE